MANKMEVSPKKAEYKGEKECDKENEKTENSPKSLSVHDRRSVFRRNYATPADIDNVSNVRIKI